MGKKDLKKILEEKIYLVERIPIGALVHVKIEDRIDERAIVLDYNYGLLENSWYMVYGIQTDKIFFAYPFEVTLLSKKIGGKKT